MTVQELIRILQQFDADSEVRLATQPSWPFEWNIADVQAVDPGGDERMEEPDPVQMKADGLSQEEIDDVCVEWVEYLDEQAENLPIVYIQEGEQLGYLPDSVAREFGWN